MPKINKAAANTLRIAVSLSLIGFLVYRNWGNFRAIMEEARHIDIFFISLAVFLYFLGVAGMVYRWGILLQGCRIKIFKPFLLQAVMIGFFYNNILPTSVGGDAYRVYDLHKNKGVDVNTGISTVVLERVMGSVTGALFLFFSFLFGMYKILNFNMVLSLIIVFVLGGLLMAILINPYVFKVDVLFKKFRLLRKIRPKVKTFRETVISYRDKRKHLLTCFIYSTIIQLFIIASYYFASRSIGLGITFAKFFFVVPFTSIVASIPITIGGIGLRENALAYLMILLGANESRAALFSFLVLFMILFNGVAGGLVYLFKNIFYKSKGII